jgi:hypothetical protein
MGPQDGNAPWSWIPEEWNTPLPYAAPETTKPSAVPIVDPPVSEDAPVQQTARVEAPPPDLDDEQNAKLDEWLKFKRDEYERFGAPPEKVDQWLDFKRKEYSKFLGRKPYGAHIAQATGPVGTINQIGHDIPMGGGEEMPLGALALPPADEAQIEIDSPFIGRPRRFVDMPDDFLGQPDAVSGADPRAELGPQNPYADAVLPDAISGAAAPTATAIGQQPLDPYGDVPAPPEDTRAPQMPDDYLDDEDLGKKYASMDPEAYEALRIKKQLAHENFVATRQIEETKKAREEAEANFRMENEARQRAATATADVNARAKKLAETDITDDAWMESRAPMQKVAAFAAAILGGLASGSTGGRNMGLEHIQNLISSHTANLRANLANKRQVLNDERGDIQNQYARDMDASHAAEVHRQAMYESAIRGLEVEAQQFDPRGTTALRIADGIQGLRSQAAQAQAAYEKESFKNSLELSKFALEQDKHLLEVAKAQPDIALKLAKLRAQGAGTGAKHPPEYFEALKLPKPPWAMTDKEHAAWLSHQKTAKDLNPNDAKSRKEEADASKAEAEAGAAKTGFVIASPETGSAFVQKDGTPFVVMDADERKRLRGITTAAYNIRRFADAIEVAKKKLGGGSTILGTEDAQELQSLAKQVDFETYKAFDLGAPSAGDTAMAEGVRGGVDLTSFLKKSTHGLQTYADGVEKKALAHLRGAGYTGDPIRFTRRADNSKAAPKLPDKFSNTIITTEYEPDFDKPGKGPMIDPRPSWVIKERNKAVDEAFVALESYAHQPGDEGDLARKHIAELADKAPSAAARARAKAILGNLPGAHVRGDAAR